VSLRVEFSPEALGDLIDLYDYIAVRDGPDRAIGYIERIEDCCRISRRFRSAAPGATIWALAYGFPASSAEP
jgi:plasmid stabilization system protein ParE